MKKYNITVNGNSYEVTVEEVAQGAYSAPVSSPSAVPSPAPAAVASPKPASSATAAKTGSVCATAPMPGTILDVKVSVGQAVKKGDVICVLEAMKMENDIPAPQDGTIASVNVTKGATVSAGDVIVTLS